MANTQRRAHHRDMTKTTDHTKFIETLAQAPIGIALREEIATRRLAERLALLAELRAAERAYLDELPDLDAGIRDAIAKLRAAELALQEANDMLRICNGAKGSATAELWRLSNIYSGRLRETASPEIAAFLAWASEEIDAAERAFRSHPRVDKNILGAALDGGNTNAASVMARCKALIAAASFARDELALEPDDAVVTATIEKLKADLPTIEPVTI